MEPLLDHPLAEIWKTTLEEVEDPLKRREQFCDRVRCCCRYESAEDVVPDAQNLIAQLMKCESLFPCGGDDNDVYFTKYALEHGLATMLRALQATGTDLHGFRWEDGRSAVHYLVERMISAEADNRRFLDLVEYILRDSALNHRDELGFAYLHGACALTGATELLRRFAAQAGGDVNLDTWWCTPLHLAARFRNGDCVIALLRLGADATRLDRREEDGGTCLHALARSPICRCTSHTYFCDHRKPVAGIVEALVDCAGASTEARDRRGRTPLRAAVARHDAALAEALLAKGADLSALDEDKMFVEEDQDFTALELKCYPLTWDILETTRVLRRHGWRMSFETRTRMLKYWMRARGDDTDHLIPDLGTPEAMSYEKIVQNLFIFNEYSFYIKPESMNHLHRIRETLREKVPNVLAELVETPSQRFTNDLQLEVKTLEGIRVNDDVSLYRLCQMDHRRAYSVLERSNELDWCAPSLLDNNVFYLRQIVKRHLANVLIRPHLTLFAADLFMTDDYKLNLPYTACRGIAEHMSNEEILRLCEQF